MDREVALFVDTLEMLSNTIKMPHGTHLQPLSLPLVVQSPMFIQTTNVGVQISIYG